MTIKRSISEKKKISKDKVIGIDTGVNTGVAVWSVSERRFVHMSTTSILKAFKIVKQYADDCRIVLVEDARQVKFKTSRYKAQGAGSVKRDCGIWEEFLEMLELRSKFVRPNKKITKINKAMFQRITGHTESTNEHSRDAGMLVYGTKGIL